MRRSLFIIPAVAAVAVSAACEHTERSVLMGTPQPSAIRLAEPDRAFRLTPEERAAIIPGFDVNALERLLQIVTPEIRSDLLRHFQPPRPGERRGILAEIFDPEMQAVLEEVWAPMWDHQNASDEAIEQGWYGWPGREIAKERRAARKHQEAGQVPLT